MRLAIDVTVVMLCVISVLGLLGYIMDKLVERRFRQGQPFEILLLIVIH